MIPWLLENALWSAALLPLVLLVSWRSGSPTLRHLAWLTLLLRLILPTCGCATDTAGADPACEMASDAAAREPTFFGVDPTREVPALAHWIEMRIGPAPLQRALALAAWLWLIGAAWVLAAELRGLLRVRALIARAGVAPRAVRDSVATLARRLGVRTPTLRVSRETALPFVWGVRRATLVLDAGQCNAAILTHELMHVKRHDGAVAVIELLAAILHWWNPLFWFARRRMRLAAEMACDAGAIAVAPTQRIAYARALIDAAAGARQRPRRLSRAIHTISGGAIEMTQRIDAIVRQAPAPSAGWRHAMLLLPLFAATLVSDDLSLRFVLDPGEMQFLAQLDATSWRHLLRRSDSSLASRPDSGAAWRSRGIALTRLGRVREAEQAFLTQLGLGHAAGLAHYNLACLYALTGSADAALDHLGQALGYPTVSRQAIREDPDLSPIRGDPRFAALLDQASRYWPP